MIKKITDVKNIGLFFNSNSIASNTFTKSNLIFAENGLGKSTLVSILKSLKENSNEIIVGRKTIHFDDTHTPLFKLLTDNRTNIEFSDNGWVNYNSIDLEIFDSEYIHKNIFTPIEISRENKVNLFKIIIGEEGKILSDSVNELKVEQTSLNSQIKDIKSRIESFSKTPLIAFENLISDDLIDIIELNESESKIHKEINDIKEFEKINKIEVLSLADDILYDFTIINLFLTKEVEIDLGEIKDKVLKYISDNLDNKGELWIKNGLSYIDEKENCPFCSQSISNNDYVNLYKQYFSDEYNRVENELGEESNKLIHSLNSLIKTIQKNKHILQKNLLLFDKWNSYIELGDIKKISNSLLDYINTYISNLDNEFELIKQSIIDKSKNTNLINEYNFSNLISIENIYRDKIRYYNTLITVSITSINEFKDNINISKLESLNIELNKVQTEKNKHSEDFLALKNNYTTLSNRLNEVSEERGNKEEQLNSYNANIFNEYKTNINRLLIGFGRRFKIIELSQSNRGSQKSVSIGIELFGKHFSLESNDIDKPSFINTLSEGDKNSLAFAFFLSKLKKSDNLENKIIIFDDPFSSLDNNRKTKLISHINQLKDDVNQIFILTHHKEFSFLVYEAINEIKTFQIKNDNTNGSKVIEYNIQNDMLNDQIKYINELKEYIDFDYCSTNEIKSKVRLSLETELRHKLHWHISKRINKAKSEGSGDCVNPITLGSLIGCLESCDNNPFRKDKDEVVTKIRNFISEFKIDLDHHSSNPQINWNNNDFERNEIIVYINDLFEIYDEYI